MDCLACPPPLVKVHAVAGGSSGVYGPAEADVAALERHMHGLTPAAPEFVQLQSGEFWQFVTGLLLGM